MNVETKFFRLTTGLVAALLLSAGALVSNLAHANGSTPFYHGSACESANLGQALQGMSWSQLGVTNNNTAGKSFFVICPVPRNNAEAIDTLGGSIQVIAAEDGSVECIWRARNPTTGSQQSATITVTEPVGNTNKNAFFDLAGMDTDTGNRHYSIVCALDPGETIAGYRVDYQ